MSVEQLEYSRNTSPHPPPPRFEDSPEKSHSNSNSHSMSQYSTDFSMIQRIHDPQKLQMIVGGCYQSLNKQEVVIQKQLHTLKAQRRTIEIQQETMIQQEELIAKQKKRINRLDVSCLLFPLLRG